MFDNPCMQVEPLQLNAVSNENPIKTVLLMVIQATLSGAILLCTGLRSGIAADIRYIHSTDDLGQTFLMLPTALLTPRVFLSTVLWRLREGVLERRYRRFPVAVSSHDGPFD